MKLINPHDMAYFVGLFDGEGCLDISYRKRGNNRDYPLRVVIGLRADDKELLLSLQKQLGGRVYKANHRPPLNPSFQWCIQDIKQLADIIIPIFDAYPLRSKKRFEYPIWRELVLERSKSRWKPAPDFESRFLAAITRIRELRKYRDVGAST